jgi:hypothetical protein
MILAWNEAALHLIARIPLDPITKAEQNRKSVADIFEKLTSFFVSLSVMSQHDTNAQIN